MPKLRSRIEGRRWERVREIPYLDTTEWRQLRHMLYLELNDVQLSRFELERDAHSGDVSLLVTDNRGRLLKQVITKIDAFMSRLPAFQALYPAGAKRH